MELTTDQPLILFENILQILGALVGFSVSYISYRGYRETGSPTMLRLATAFLLLGSGFAISSIIDLHTFGMLPDIALILSALVFGAAALETAGYFFLAFSHMINVRMSQKIGLAYLSLFPTTFPLAALKSVSIYFLFYGVVETVMSYIRVRRLDTLVIAIGLSVIGLAEFIRWTSLLYPASDILPVASLVIKIIGLSTFCIPVIKYAYAGGMKQG